MLGGWTLVYLLGMLAYFTIINSSTGDIHVPWGKRFLLLLVSLFWPVLLVVGGVLVLTEIIHNW